MARDAIVEQVRAIREAFAKEHGYDVKAIVHALQRRQADGESQPVFLKPKRIGKKQPDRKAG